MFALIVAAVFIGYKTIPTIGKSTQSITNKTANKWK